MRAPRSRDVLHRYAYLAGENGDLGQIAALFTPDAQFVLPDGTPVSRDEVYKIAGARLPTFIRHHLTTSMIEFTSESTPRRRDCSWRIPRRRNLNTGAIGTTS